MYIKNMHTITAKIEHGRQIGRTTGYPTINLDIQVPLHLPHGVYYGTVTLEDGRIFDSAIIVGTPHKVYDASIQAFLLNFNEDIYNTTVTLKIMKFVRPLITFDSREELVTQIELDILQIKQIITEQS